MEEGQATLTRGVRQDNALDYWIQEGTTAVEQHPALADGGVGFNTAAGDTIAQILWAVFEGEGGLEPARELLDRGLRYYEEEVADHSDAIARRRKLGKVRDKSNDYS